MTEKWITTKADLLPQIEEQWTALHTLFNTLTDHQLTQIKNPDGWSIKDHVAHMTAWENSVIAVLTGKPRHIGLGVPEVVYASNNLDAINKVIFEAHKDDPTHVVFPAFHQTHHQLLDLLDGMSDEDLNQPYSHYLPNEKTTGGHLPVINVVYGNTIHHFKEHLGWIVALLAEHQAD